MNTDSRKLFRLALCFLTVAILGGLLMATAARADQTITYEDYQELIARIQQEVKAARSSSPDECRAMMERIASELEAVTSVRMPDGTLMAVDNCALSAALRAQSCDLERVESILGGYCADDDCASRRPAEGTAGDASPDDGATGEGGKAGGEANPEALDWLRRILEERGLLPDSSEPAVAPGALGDPSSGSGPMPPISGGQRSDGSGESPPTAPTARPPSSQKTSPIDLKPLLWLVIIVALLLLVAGVGLETHRWWARREGRPVPDKRTPAKDRITVPPAVVDQATQLAEAGRYREAMRYLYLGVLGRLGDRGRIRLDNALTNHELLRLAVDANLTARLTPVIATFDRIWYGVRPLDRPGYEAFAAHVAALDGE